MFAASNGHLEVVELLLEAGADKNAAERWGNRFGGGYAEWPPGSAAIVAFNLLREYEHVPWQLLHSLAAPRLAPMTQIKHSK